MAVQEKAITNHAEANSEVTGLTEAQAEALRARGLGNTPPPPTNRTYSEILRENVFTLINISLFGLGIGLALLGRTTDALVSLVVVSSNVIVSVVQEIRAKRTLDRIALLNRPTATVIRDGQPRVTSPEMLVIGDLLQVGAGDQIVLDGRVVGDGRMMVDESQLTGESDAITKKAGDTVYSGSFCVTGGGRYIAEKVGEQSLSNEITAGARAYRRVLTPLQRGINLVVQITLLIVVYLEFLLFFNAWIKQVDLADSVENSTVLAGLVPNGLFLSISVAYALAAVRLVRYGALVQQSNAIESLSNVDVLCLDKTGTLTANRLQVQALHPVGMSNGELSHLLGAMMASTQHGNKTSEALATAYPEQAHPVVAEVPFSSARKWSALAFDDGDLKGVYVLGAPEMVHPCLAADTGWEALAQQAQTWTDQGLRVLLVAHGADPRTLHNEDDDSHLPDDMQPLGLVSLSDELRPEAEATLAGFQQIGVQPKIISGDNPETVAALARQAGLGPEIPTVSGLDLASMDEAQFSAVAAATTVFGRITPQQKERLVRALREQGHYVAMIGDGVNDVLSLKQANVGIAMQSGSQAARAVADVVLLKDSFAALLPAVKEGQRILNGMDDILKIFLTRICTMGILILSSMVIGLFPFDLRSVSLITLLTVGIPTVALAVFARPGASFKQRSRLRIAHFVLPPTVMSSILGLLLFYGVMALNLAQLGALEVNTSPQQYEAALRAALPLAHTTLALFLVWTGLCLIVFVEPPTEWWVGGDELSGDWRPTLLAGGLGGLALLSLTVPGLRHLFALAPLDTAEVMALLAAGLVWLFLVRFIWRANIMERYFGLS